MTLVTPTRQTNRLFLRPFTTADRDALFELHSNAKVLRFWDAPPWNERSQADRFLERCAQLAEEGSGVRLAISLRSDDAFIGWCTLSRWNQHFRSASLGYCLSDDAWGYGYATEAVTELLTWAFDTLDLNRVQAEVDTRNAASARVHSRLLQNVARGDVTCAGNPDHLPSGNARREERRNLGWD